MTAPAETFTCPPDLTLVGDEELGNLHDAGQREFARVYGGDITTDTLRYADQLASDMDRIRAEQEVRRLRTERETALSRDSASRQMEALRERVQGPAEGGQEPAGTAALTADQAAELVQAAVTATLAAVNGSPAAPRPRPSLSSVREHAPDPKVARGTGNMRRVTSSLALPTRGLEAGADVPDIGALADLVIERTKGLATTQLGGSAPRHPVASVRNEFAHTVDDRTSPAAIQAMIDELTGGPRQDALLAGGGWCAPSEIRYDLFNISDQSSGLIDLPTVGVSRGGLQFPVSPSIADVFYTSGASNAASGMGGFAFTFSNGTDPWLWTEADDIATVTGTTNKPVLRVPCASFSTQRLEAYGLTLTAGNLTDSAYPEATQNFLRLLRNAYSHTVNARLIALMAAACTAVGGTLGTANAGAFQTVMNAVGLAATDYRNKYAMRDDAVLEVVFPFWVQEVLRADLAWRVYGDNSLLAVTDEEIRGHFADRGVAVQFVSDWQVRGASQFGNTSGALTTWPSTVQFMIYAAGTFLHGTGLSLDLGVIRDSVLNAENDFSAAWMEEAHLIAKVGHEGRKYTVGLYVGGSGAAAVSAGANL